MFGKRFSRALAVTTVASLVMATAAFADDIANNVDGSVDATAEVLNRLEGDPSSVVELRIIANNENDPDNGCNMDGSTEKLTLNVLNSNPGAATVTPAKVEFSGPGCGDTPDLTVTPIAAGTANITFTVDSNSTGGSFNLAPAAFSVVVTSPNVAPSAPGAPTAAVNPTNGSVALSWTAATDADGDTLTYSLEGHNASTATFSPIASGLGLSQTHAASEGTWTYRVRAFDGTVNGPYSASSAAIVVDKSAPTAPTASFAPATADYFDGSMYWWNEDVTVSYGGSTDPNLLDSSNGSGVASDTADQTFSTTGSHPYSGTATDNAGNQSAATTGSVGVDKTNPTIDFDSCPSTVVLNSTVSLDWTASDGAGQSGLATAATGSVNLVTNTVGPKTATSPIASDNVGNQSTADTCSYTVGYSFSGFFQPVDNNGVLNSVKAGQAVPLKFRLTDANGDPVLSGVTASVSVTSLSCTSGTSVDQIEEVASGSSGLQNLGDGYYQFNWKTPTTYANSCKTMRLNLGEGGPTLIGDPLAPNPDAIFHTALFQFKK